MSFDKKARAIKRKNQKQYKAKVKKFKEQKRSKRQKSRLRHPFKAIHRGKHRVKEQESFYWHKGRQYAEDRINKKPQYYYTDKTAIKGMSRQLGPAKTTAVIIVSVVVLCFIVYGFIIEHF